MNVFAAFRVMPSFCLLLAGLVHAGPGETSRLWGKDGEKWRPAGRLPDFSYAGYHRGERPLPALRPEASVKDFGAVGDGKTDDTAAFKRALTEAAGKVIAIPAGRYVITDILGIQRSGTVLQGEGPDKTVILAPKPLEKIRSNRSPKTNSWLASKYSWCGGIIWATGLWEDKLLAKVTATARRGESSLVVDKPASFQVGDEVRLILSDDDKHALVHHLYAGDPGDITNLKDVKGTWIARVVKVDLGKREIAFDRSLRTDVRPEWEPVLHPARSTVEEVGIEHLAFEFPATPYGGHFTELGNNAIEFKDIRNGWVRDIEVRNADSGVFIAGANNTVTGVVLTSAREPNPLRTSTGHHGISLKGTDLLLAHFDFRTKFIHDITMVRRSAGNAVHSGRGIDLAFDHHKYANHANLFTDIDAGVGTNIFHSGGGAKLGRNCGAWSTWWNIRTQRPVRFPARWAPDMINIIGVRPKGKSQTALDGRWYEVIEPAKLRPPNLYEAQLKRRLGAMPPSRQGAASR
jgi:hypothetical protein